MLDTTTKKRINDCRDILVGKLPDPKAQIEQITIGLIYKFMDDMDKEAVELGGEAKFFKDYEIQDPEDNSKKIKVPFEKYSWDNLFHSKTTANEMLNLYSGAIEGMEKNPNLPQLFRDIFNNAYLPYRDPETLKLFLKTINEFEYSHSEKLGDAFEYLLSVMGSQGDAGQFRTPRHIIDFIVKIVDPSRSDSILDPACGTAGFLISAFKHIKSKNQKGLTPDQQNSLVKNFVGYDISPDMVRLSLVNLYLHGFTTPNIFEFDTLSNEDKWDDDFDIIIANPPFMTPKGGIKPHKRFSIKAKKAEILFVDYILEHLRSKGKAGIVVPNGIISTTQSAYKKLRSKLIDQGLLSIISLPGGIFNPYSGVTTSILIIDKELSKKTDSVHFIEIKNDGYDLGAQRNPIPHNDLPVAIEVINDLKDSLKTGKKLKNENRLGYKSIIKTEIKDHFDITFKLKAYQEKIIWNSKYPIVPLEDICDFKRGPFGGSLKKEIFVPKGYAVYEQSHAINNSFENFRYFITKEKYNEMIKFKVNENDLIISCSGTMGKIAIVPSNAPTGIINQALLRLTASDKILPEFLKIMLESDSIQERHFRDQEGAAIQNVASVKYLKQIEIPLPSIKLQKKILGEIRKIRKENGMLLEKIETNNDSIQASITEIWGENM